MVTIFPRPIITLMMSGTVLPIAAERSLTVTPEGTLTGPVGGATGCFGGRASWRSRAWRAFSRGRFAALSITTRRLRRPVTAPWRGRIGRFGLLGPLAMGVSVEPCQRGIHAHGLSKDTVESGVRRGPLEAGQAPARVGPAPRGLRPGCQSPVVGDEAEQVGLWNLPPAPGARPDRCAHAALESSSSTDASTS